MPVQHSYGGNHLHFLTASTYRRARVFDSERFRRHWCEKKRVEKLNYMHGNPTKRRLVAEPGDWQWSSWRFYQLGDVSVLATDRIP